MTAKEQVSPYQGQVTPRELTQVVLSAWPVTVTGPWCVQLPNKFPAGPVSCPELPAGEVLGRRPGKASRSGAEHRVLPSPGKDWDNPLFQEKLQFRVEISTRRLADQP